MEKPDHRTEPDYTITVAEFMSWLKHHHKQIFSLSEEERNEMLLNKALQIRPRGFVCFRGGLGSGFQLWTQLNKLQSDLKREEKVKAARRNKVQSRG